MEAPGPAAVVTAHEDLMHQLLNSMTAMQAEVAALPLRMGPSAQRRHWPRRGPEDAPGCHNQLAVADLQGCGDLGDGSGSEAVQRLW